MKTIRVEDWYENGAPETVTVKSGEIFYPVDHASRSQGNVWTGKYYLWTEENPDLEWELEADDLLYYDLDEHP